VPEPDQFSEMSTDELLTLLRYHTSQAALVAREIAAREAGHRRRAPDGVPPEPPEPPAGSASASDIDWATRYTPTKADAVLVEEVLRRATDEIQEAVIHLVEEVTDFDGVREVIPERPRDKKPPAYIRVAVWDRTFAYVQVRRDSLRLDLAMPAEDAEGLGDNARARDVKEDNSFKVSVYVRGPEDVGEALEAMRHAHDLADKAVRA
jgi:hypothetical protein